MDKSNAIEHHLRALIGRGRHGERLPSVRQLQHEFAAGPGTINQVLRTLKAEGLVVARPGDGTTIADRTTATHSDTSWQTVALGRAMSLPGGLDHLTTLATPATLLLDSGFPEPSLQASAILSRIASKVVKHDTAWERCLPEGLVGLRTLLAAEIGPDVSAEDVIVTAGAQSAIGIILRSLMRPGDRLIIENPSYPGAMGIAALSGFDLVPVPTDEFGIRPDLLADALRRSGARVVFLQPRIANPTGISLAADRRAEVLRVVRDAQAFVIEDDWVRDLTFGDAAASAAPLIADDPHGHVIYVRSVSKLTAPGMRIAGIAARGPVSARLRAARLFADFFAPPLLQAVLLEFMRAPEWTKHVNRLRSELALRHESLLDALNQSADFTVLPSTGGVALWVGLPESVDEPSFVSACAARGVRVSPGRNYWSGDAGGPHVRVSFAAASSADLRTAATRMTAALDDVSA
jgi:DNA-binding transcriptional MocR family regulator